MKWINAEQQVTATIYDEEHEEHNVKTMTVEEMLDSYTNEGCPTIYSNPERKKGKWIYDGKGFYMCSSCGKPWVHWWARVVPLNRMCKELRYCPMCGADMRGESE